VSEAKTEPIGVADCVHFLATRYADDSDAPKTSLLFLTMFLMFTGAIVYEMGIFQH
jgi:hypothetical protein